MERYVSNYYPTVDQMAIDGGVVGVNDVPMDRWTPFVLRSDYDAQLADAQATITALQAERDEYKTMYACLTGETYDNPIADLKAQLTQRTAELEAIEKILDIDSGKTTVEKVRDLHHSFKQVWESYQDASNEMFKAQAELERVRGELQSAEAGYFVAERDLQGANNKYDELRTLIAALPKVEGGIETWDHDNGLMFTCSTRPVSRYAITFRSSEERDAYAALLQHRQGMEG